MIGEAKNIKVALEDRMKRCRLELHPDKTNQTIRNCSVRYKLVFYAHCFASISRLTINYNIILITIFKTFFSKRTKNEDLFVVLIFSNISKSRIRLIGQELFPEIIVPYSSMNSTFLGESGSGDTSSSSSSSSSSRQGKATLLTNHPHHPHHPHHHMNQ